VRQRSRDCALFSDHLRVQSAAKPVAAVRYNSAFPYLACSVHYVFLRLQAHAIVQSRLRHANQSNSRACMHIVAGLFVAQWRPRWSAFSLSSRPAASGERQRRLQRAPEKTLPQRAASPNALSQNALTGGPRVIDGDTIELAGVTCALRASTHPRSRRPAGAGSSARGPAAPPRARRSRSSLAERPSPATAVVSTSTGAPSASASSPAATSTRRWCAKATPGTSSNTRRATCRGSGGARSAHRHRARQGRACVGVPRASLGRRGGIRAKGLRNQRQRDRPRPNIPHARGALVRQDPDRRGEGQALLLLGGRGAGRRLAPGRGSLTKHLQCKDKARRFLEFTVPEGRPASLPFAFEG
jgi:hypothetical protein